MKELKQFLGYSGSKVCLMENEGILFVRKEGKIHRNIERYESLKDLHLPFPSIINKTTDFYDMEYIRHIDMKTYLKFFDGEMLSDFLLSIISVLSSNQEVKDYSGVYQDMLLDVPWKILSFSKQDLYDKLPKKLPAGQYHGDLTLDNILFDVKNERFVLIDPVTSVYDSFVFDLAKLNQDLVCGWFTRDEFNNFHIKTKNILNTIISKHVICDNKYLTILMLFRIIPYCKNEYDKNFVVKSIEDLWM